MSGVGSSVLTEDLKGQQQETHGHPVCLSHLAGQLGDGRAISIGEVAGPTGRYELQLKV